MSVENTATGADALIDINGTRVHVTHWGTSGPRVILVHGSAQGSQLGGDMHFDHQQVLADRGWQVLVPDRPGHGQSPDPGRPDDADLDGALIEELLGAGAHVVGHSFGAAVALAAAAQRPELIKSLTMIEPALQILATDVPAVRRFIFRLVRILLFSLTPARRIMAFAAAVGIPDTIRGGKSDEELARMGRGIKQLRLPKKEALLRQLGVIRERQIPLMVVTGGWNPAFEAVGDRVAKLGSGQRVVIASPHHFPQSISNEFNDTLDEFMRQHEH
jgi:pimeloyl-ACP methyl ester carboxylesterase